MEAGDVVIKFFEARNAHDLAAMMALVAEGIVNHAPAGVPSPPGSDGVRKAMAMEMAAFPDHHVEILEVVTEGDRVVVLGQSSGTHEGSFAGIAPTGNRFDVRVFQMFRVDGGLIIEHWGLFDRMSMLEQLGVLPSKSGQ